MGESQICTQGLALEVQVGAASVSGGAVEKAVGAHQVRFNVGKQVR